MRIVSGIVTMLLALALPAAARAVIVFNVSGTFTTVNNVATPGAGTLTGTFTTNDAITLVTAINLTSSTNGPFNGFSFTGYNYNNAATIDNQQLPNTFRLTVNSNGNQLQLFFSPALNAAGGTIGGNSFEHQAAGGNRGLTGTVTSQSAAVPEPASWGMMVAGFGLLGAALRQRRRAIGALFA